VGSLLARAEIEIRHPPNSEGRIAARGASAANPAPTTSTGSASARINLEKLMKTSR